MLQLTPHSSCVPIWPSLLFFSSILFGCSVPGESPRFLGLTARGLRKKCTSKSDDIVRQDPHPSVVPEGIIKTTLQ